MTRLFSPPDAKLIDTYDISRTPAVTIDVILNFLSFFSSCPDSDGDQGGGGRGSDGAQVVRGRRGGEQQGGDGGHLPHPDPAPLPQPQHPLRQPLHRAQGGEGEPHGA